MTAEENRVNRSSLNRIRSVGPWALCLSVAALSVAGCGGGGGSSSPVVPVSTTTPVQVSVVDGAIKGGVVCLDKNGNGLCDTGEPTGTTDAGGNATLTVDNADLGLFPVVVTVGTDAIDADTGPVTVPFSMAAPADQVSVVSPLTTLVQAQIATSGGTSAQAAAIVQTQTGLTVSLFSNYTLTKTTDTAAMTAANLARLIVLATQQQTTALAPDIGQADLSGATVSAADIQSAVAKTLIGSLPVLAAAAADPTVSAATTSAARDAALATLATALIAKGQAGLTPATALTTIGLAKLPADNSAVAAQPSASLRALTFTDANNWYFRAIEATAADNTADANGLLHYYDNYSQDKAGNIVSWGFSSLARQGDLHWDGTTWTGCPLGLRSSQTPRDANGIFHSFYCDGFQETVFQRFAVDVSGKTISSVIDTIHAFPGSDSNASYASFGPVDTTVLGTATMPAGSSLLYFAGQTLSNALAYDVTSVVSGYTPAVAAGQAAGTSGAACSMLTGANQANFLSPVGTLENLILAAPGKPCVFGPTNALWGLSVLSLGSLPGAIGSPDSTLYSNTELLKIAFDPQGNVAIYLTCLSRISDGSSRNCTELGRGTYAIQTLGDARVLTASNPPSEVLRLGYSRIFVERGGKVFFGYQSLSGVKTNQVRLNLPAANALFSQLGLPPLAPS